MQLFKRIYFSVFGSLDAVVSRIQNHDALVGVSLKDLERKIKDAQITYGSLIRTLEKIERDASQAQADHTLWTSRAKTEAQNGTKDSALECLRRAHRAKNTYEALQKQRDESLGAQRKLQSIISELQSTQKALTLKHRELKARTEINEASDFSRSVSSDDIKEMLGRWEDALGSFPAEPSAADRFQERFDSQEQQAALEAELAALTK